MVSSKNKVSVPGECVVQPCLFEGECAWWVLVENFCANFENPFQKMGMVVDDKYIMDDEIEESLFEMSLSL